MISGIVSSDEGRIKATATWDGKARRLLVDEADTDPLIGMALLRGYELKMQIRRQGKVTIKRLSHSSSS
jgi:hypothetical protein